MRARNKRTSKRRNRNGSSLSEFGPALIVFICMFLIPVIDIGFIPIRYLISQGVINEITHRLSLAETRSDAYTLLASDMWWQDFLAKCGVEVVNPQLKLIVCGQSTSDNLALNQGAKVPTQWLPQGSKAPCIYSLELSADCEIAPLFKGSDAGVPGFNSPITISMKSRSHWENLGRNPRTSEYFINE